MGFGPLIPHLMISPIPRDANGFVRGFAPAEDFILHQGAVEVQDFQSSVVAQLLRRETSS